MEYHVLLKAELIRQPNQISLKVTIAYNFKLNVSNSVKNCRRRRYKKINPLYRTIEVGYYSNPKFPSICGSRIAVSIALVFPVSQNIHAIINQIYFR
ncbi:MAG: hypothetical protein A4E58_01687 [Syntrophorhabdus sp. PtaB.Bin006]|nr:MAG: hypothetical protein A4E58_01687 [Syntrophorhabdus sp. PtaB.Bin006]